MKKRILKPFDIAKAKAGAEVCTRDERKVRIVCFDIAKTKYPLLALATDENGVEDELRNMENGRYFPNSISKNDLMLVEHEEQPQFKPFDKVIFRYDDNHQWTAGYFSHSENIINGKTIYNCNGIAAYQCLPFEGNEHLVGTCKSLK